MTYKIIATFRIENNTGIRRILLIERWNTRLVNNKISIFNFTTLKLYVAIFFNVFAIKKLELNLNV